MKIPFPYIPDSEKWTRIHEITKGWATDKKYFIQAQEGAKYLLRISDKSSISEEKEVYDLMKQLDGLNMAVSKLLTQGLCNEGQNTYRLFSWVEGQDARDIIKNLSQKQQYSLGLQAGSSLRKIHSIPSPVNGRSWSEYYNWKIDRNIRNYSQCQSSFSGADLLINFINNNRHLILNRPQCFHHGDYHMGNMVITEKSEIGVIDFNRLDYGDPWEEFNRIVWCVEESSVFASGRIDGYFEGNIPTDFFKLMSLYIASNQLGGFSWAESYGQEQWIRHSNQTLQVLEWYEDFKKEVPVWYTAKEKR